MLELCEGGKGVEERIQKVSNHLKIDNAKETTVNRDFGADFPGCSKVRVLHLKSQVEMC